jgi:hypothetical protein
MFEDSEQLQILFEKACKTNNVALVDLILLFQFDCIDPSCFKQFHAFHNSCCNGHVEILDRLLQEPKFRVYELNNEFKCASEYGHIAVVNRLLQEPTELVDPSFCENEPIYVAFRNGFVDIVDRLLQDMRVLQVMMDCRKASNTNVINFAMNYGKIAVVDRLLQEPTEYVDPTYNQNRALKLAKKFDYKDIVNLLLQDKRVQMFEFTEKLLRKQMSVNANS